MTLTELMETLPYGPAPEAAQPALDWLKAHQGKFGLFIGGKWRDPASQEWFATLNPANAQKLAEVAQASAVDVDEAVKAARKAFIGWSQTPGHVRARYLYAMARQVQKHARLFAVLETLDNGKPIRETRDIDIPLVARHFYYHAGWAQLMESELAGYAPLGVVGQIIPWNFPLLMLSWKIAPALAMGNTVVLKPAEFTPLTALLFAEICQSIGLPPGVVNILTGDGKTGAALVEHPGVDKIAFTGSTEVGRLIRKATAGSGKKLSLELGGKSPFLVFEDADLDSAVEGVVDAIWFNQGQVCCAGSRLLVQEGIAERMYTKLRARMEKLRVGNPLDKAVDIGAIVAPVQLQKIQQLVQKGVEEGARLWQPSWAVPSEGCFYPPTLFTEVAPASTIAQEEIFGPVLAALTFRTPEEAVRLANNTRYGLAASIWSEDINLALDIATQIKAGTIWINSTNLFDAASGFGGYRESGFGREGGKEGLWEYVKKAESPHPKAQSRKTRAPSRAAKETPSLQPATFSFQPPIDRTAKLFIGGRQARPDSGYSKAVYAPDGQLLGEVGLGNRKDIRNAVEAARAAFEAWRKASAHNRAQILYFLAENLSERAEEFGHRIHAQTGQDGHAEVEAALEALFTAAAWADKYEGVVHPTPIRNVTLAIPEPIGVMGILCPDDQPLLALARLAGTALALGNTLVVVPSPLAPLVATDFYQVLETSDIPAGTFNIVTGERDELAKTLAEHDDVDAVWYAGPQAGHALVERASAGNMKRTWMLLPSGPLPNTDEILRQATQVKNIWVPYGA
ncbi:aldehyde dehydrogenase family protein [Meiothermus hypogaeus]|uniref:Aldehyde dehydrogenase n=2 Tax=Meiothermus hypogaeus TaxID=884155 RepID=A0A511QXM4_9DEIN|nr:aldehyde dehydrogenase family protein [Meiothermus hypogaeus]RIH80870.1 putative aldehyde dehydrogenase AldA [Meiothermus hypogaeus]GEM82134.1 aldehyde dehydrogenase [Meiothermus hypogaeus NBRC 106114]GIW37125.1 MAG: aldehyde dehydrogenase [Meiothermus sp.]